MKGFIKSITTKYIIIGLLIIGLIASFTSITFWFTSHLKNDARRINLAGRERMRSYEMAWLLDPNPPHKAIKGEGEVEDTRPLNYLEEEMAIFEEVLYALRDGSKKYRLDPMPQKDYIFTSYGNEAVSQIDSLIKKWRSEVKPMLTKAVEGDPGAFRQYNLMIHSYVDEIDSFVNYLEQNYKKEFIFYNGLHLVAIALSALVFISLILFIRKTLVKPILRLRDAAGEIEKGNLEVRVEAETMDEIGELSNAFNSMARARKEAEEALRNVAEGVSAETGEEFFRSLVQYLAKTLEMDYAFVGELAGEEGESVRTIAVFTDDEIVDNFEYQLANTPCENVVGKGMCCYPRGVQQQFPLDHLLVEMGIESYIGTPLFDSAGRPLGLLEVMDRKPLSNEGTVKLMLKIFAVRASAEMERKQAEEKLRQLLQKYEALINTIDGIVWEADAQTFQYSFVSRQAERLLGYPVDRWLTEPAFCKEHIHLDDVEWVIDHCVKATAEKRPHDFEYRFIAADGHTVWVRNIVAVVTENDQPVKLRGIMVDITERKQAEEALKKHGEEVLALTDASNVLGAVTDTEDIYEAICNIVIRNFDLKMAWLGLIEEESRALNPVAQFGFEGEYLSSLKIAKDDLPRGAEEHAQQADSAAIGPAGMAIKTLAYQVINDIATDPRYIPWRGKGYNSLMAVPLLSSEAKTIGVLNLYSSETQFFTKDRIKLFLVFANQAVTVIENRWHIEGLEGKNKELSELFRLVACSKEEWQNTFDNIMDLISIHDRDFNIIKANRAFAEYFGFHPREVINKKCYELFCGTDSPVSNCPHRITVNESRMAIEEIEDPKTNKIFRVSTFPYYSPKGELIGTVHIARDITEEREKEMRLIMSERLASLGQMASGIAHEINNPLASIAGCAEGLLGKVQKGRYEPELFENYLKIIEEEILRCKGITTNMLSIVRTTTYEKKEININEVLNKTLELILFQGRLEDVEVIKNYTEGMPVVHGSESELRQAFLAIITNALDAMEDKGALTIDTGIEGESVFIKISDTGTGIPDEHISMIFNLFFTTKSERGSTGLGLSIVHKIITNHNGDIYVISEKGKGATFRITLPTDNKGHY